MLVSSLAGVSSTLALFGAFPGFSFSFNASSGARFRDCDSLSLLDDCGSDCDCDWDWDLAACARLCFSKTAAKPLTVFGVKNEVSDRCFFSLDFGVGAMLEIRTCGCCKWHPLAIGGVQSKVPCEFRGGDVGESASQKLRRVEWLNYPHFFHSRLVGNSYWHSRPVHTYLGTLPVLPTSVSA